MNHRLMASFFLYNRAQKTHDFLGVLVCFCVFCWPVCVGERNVLSYSVCSLVTWLPLPQGAERVCVVNTCARMPPHQPCRAAFLFSDANFIPSQLVFSQGFSMQSQMGVLPAASLFSCISICLHAVGDWHGFSLLAVVACHLQVFLHLSICLHHALCLL